MMLETGAVSLEELLEARMLLEVPVAGLAALQAGRGDDRPPARGARRRDRGRRRDMDAVHAADTEFHRDDRGGGRQPDRSRP